MDRFAPEYYGTSPGNYGTAIKKFKTRRRTKGKAEFFMDDDLGCGAALHAPGAVKRLAPLAQQPGAIELVREADPKVDVPARE
ncbi:hypothetical protein PAPYR_9528 [Paratrimastix pyriformis]|uniref:Uncharacterized protein n=1 Tax=Paratrimastix pyriformis TaxID=342808 RepID=A0ABQ8U847_9EUKA|nr:hypothetical protein PAPYR_9528 [Paratrimastix pyriformis]